MTGLRALALTSVEEAQRQKLSVRLNNVLKEDDFHTLRAFFLTFIYSFLLGFCHSRLSAGLDRSVLTICTQGRLCTLNL